MKYFDVVTENDAIIGSATAAECHTNPKLIHRVVYFTLVDGVKEKIFISKQSSNMKFDDRMWCFMREHLLRDEDYPAAVYRGLKDELGFDGNEGVGEKGHAVFHQLDQTEFARFFIAYYKDGAIKPNPAEIAEIKWVSLDELIQNKHDYSSMSQYWIDHVDWDEIMRFTRDYTQSEQK